LTPLSGCGYNVRMTTFTPYRSEQDKINTPDGTMILSGSYVTELDWFAYCEYLDAPGSVGMIWWDLSANDRDAWREHAREVYDFL